MKGYQDQMPKTDKKSFHQDNVLACNFVFWPYSPALDPPKYQQFPNMKKHLAQMSYLLMTFDQHKALFTNVLQAL